MFDAVGELWRWVRRRRRRLRVHGESMSPTLEPGEFVLFEPAATFEVGDVVVAHHPSRPMLLVKRVGAVDPVGLVDLVSDNEDAGSDSADFGRVDVDDVEGRVTISLDWPFRSVR